MTDLVTLWRKSPALLEACVLADSHEERIYNICNLRLVSKESSKIALNVVRRYSLNLENNDSIFASRDTNVSGARLLQQTQLHQLKMNLCLTDSFSPAVLLHGFVREVGNALATVTELDMCIENFGNSAVTTDILSKEVALLVQACPALTSLTSNIVPPPLMRLLGAACPQITLLNMSASDDNVSLSGVRNIMLQPLVFPHLKILSLPHIGRDFPDLSRSHSLRVLYLCSFIFSEIVDWQRLPPKLEQLQIRCVTIGPPTYNGDGSGCHLLPNLLCLRVSNNVVPLHALAQLLRAAPALQAIKNGCDPLNSLGYANRVADPYIVVDCSKTESTATDLIIVRQNMSLDSIVNAMYFFDSSKDDADTVWQSVSADLCVMPGFSSCAFSHCEVPVLQQLLRVFPDIRSLVLGHLDVYDVQLLQIMPSLSNLTKLEIHQCHSISPMGLLAMCYHLTNLRHIRCKGCDELHASDLDSCQRLATRNISIEWVQEFSGFYDE